MNPDIKTEWVAALRSGDYKQGKHSLKEGDRYCCLGVLCDVAAKHGVGHWTVDGLDEHFLISLNDYSPLRLPIGVAQFAGTGEESPRVRRDDRNTYLTDLNDQGATFAEIADLIEEQL